MIIHWQTISERCMWWCVQFDRVVLADHEVTCPWRRRRTWRSGLRACQVVWQTDLARRLQQAKVCWCTDHWSSLEVHLPAHHFYRLSRNVPCVVTVLDYMAWICLPVTWHPWAQEQFQYIATVSVLCCWWVVELMEHKRVKTWIRGQSCLQKKNVINLLHSRKTKIQCVCMVCK